MADDIEEFVAELLAMWADGKCKAVVTALAGHEQSTVVKFARALDAWDYDRGSRGSPAVDAFILLLEARGR